MWNGLSHERQGANSDLGNIFWKPVLLELTIKLGWIIFFLWRSLRDMCIPMADSCFDVWQKLTQYCKAVIFQLKIRINCELRVKGKSQPVLCLWRTLPMSASSKTTALGGPARLLVAGSVNPTQTLSGVRYIFFKASFDWNFWFVYDNIDFL